MARLWIPTPALTSYLVSESRSVLIYNTGIRIIAPTLSSWVRCEKGLVQTCLVQTTKVMAVVVVMMVLAGQDRKCCSTEDRRHPEEGGAPERIDGVLSGAFSFLELSFILQLAQSFLRVLSEQGWSRSV